MQSGKDFSLLLSNQGRIYFTGKDMFEMNLDPFFVFYFRINQKSASNKIQSFLDINSVEF
jgi:hypothetical protein